ncbi:Major royal jelly protein/protein yellow [Sergentomyia squamirostris]
MRILFGGILCIILIAGQNWSDPQDFVEEVFKWKRLVYDNLPQAENSYIGPYPYYDPENADITAMAYHPASGLMIVNVVRLRPGIPSSLAAFCVNEYKIGSSPKLWGFPNYEVNALRTSDFQKENYYHDDQEYRKHHKRPNKYGQNNNYHGSHNYDNNYGEHHNQQPSFQKPYYTTSTSYYTTTKRPYYTKPPIATTISEKPYQGLKRIVSTYTTTISEKCNLAYTIDVGVLNYYGNSTRVIQKPAILVFGLQSDCCETRNFPLIRRSTFPKDIANSIPFGILWFTLDYQSDDCDDLFIYITNTFTNTIIVYDYKRNDYWYFNTHPSFAPVIAESHMVFDKTFFYDLPLGVVSLVLGYPDKYGDRTAYYIAGASTAQFAVSTAILKDKSNSPASYNPDDFSIMGYRGCNNQAVMMTVDYTLGVVFYTEMQSNKVQCWNLNKPLNPDNLGVVYDSEDKMLYGVHLFVDSRGYLWFMSSHLPIVLFTDQPLNLKEVNNEIFRVKVSDVIRGTVCDNEDRYRHNDILY